ncbi:hypothetical protein Tco_0862560 [Tanacetum coccineum]
MSDSEDSTVTYTEVSSPFEGLSDIGSPGVDGLSMMLEDPYVEAALQAPPSLDYEDEEDPEEDLEEDPTGYPADGGDDDDDDDESSDDDEDDNDDVEEDKDEEEHPAPVDFVPPPVHRVTATITPPLGTPPLLLIPLPTSSPPLLLPSTDCRAGVSEVTLPPRKRLCIALGLRYKIGKSSSTLTARPTRCIRADYGFVSTLDDEIRRDPERDVGYRITD